MPKSSSVFWEHQVPKVFLTMNGLFKFVFIKCASHTLKPIHFDRPLVVSCSRGHNSTLILFFLFTVTVYIYNSARSIFPSEKITLFTFNVSVPTVTENWFPDLEKSSKFIVIIVNIRASVLSCSIFRDRFANSLLTTNIYILLICFH